MSRLPRPTIPLDVKLDVALRQIGDDATRRRAKIMIAILDRKLRKTLDAALFLLACTLGCPVKDFQLDHDPALENREKLVELESGRRRRVIVVPKGAKVIRYFPDANDPDHLFYRPHSAEIAGSHKVKTNVRGDHGQLSDNAIARKERRRHRPCSRCRQHDRLPGKRLCKRCMKVAEKYHRKYIWPKGRKIQNRGFSRRPK